MAGIRGTGLEVISPNLSVWMDTSGEYRRSSPLEDKVTADVAVIGGGVMGLSAAWHLRRSAPGQTVVVVEQAFVGAGSSGRNNGVLAAGTGFAGPFIKRIYGMGRLQELLAYGEQSLERTRALIRDHRLDVDHRERVPHLRIAIAEPFVAQLERQYTAECSAGAEQEWLDAGALASRYPGPLIGGAAAIRDRAADVINPMRYVRELKRLTVEAGGIVYEGSPVIDIRRIGGSYRIDTPGGALLAPKIVLATNAYTDRLPGSIIRGTDQWPIYAYKLATEPLSDELWSELGWEPNLRVADSLSMWHSMRRTSDGRMTFGGAVYRVADRALQGEYNARIFSLLERHFRAFFPNLHGVRISHKWGGLISTTFDLAPHVGFVDERGSVVRISGCWGHGLATAYLNGQVASNLLQGVHDEYTDHWIVRRTPRGWPVAPVRFVGMAAVLERMRRSARRALADATRASRSAAQRRALTELSNYGK